MFQNWYSSNLVAGDSVSREVAHKMSVKKKFLAVMSVLSAGFISGYGLIAYAHVIPGVDEV